MSTTYQISIGVIGTANIARKNIRGIKLSKFAKCIAVGSRNLNHAKEYCLQVGLTEKEAFGSYDEVLRNETIQGLYIPLPTAFHHDMILKCVKHKKHILCEKPCALDAIELLKMLKECYENKIIFVDGVMFMHNSRLYKLRNEIDNELVLGKNKVREVSSAFCFRGDEDFFKNNIRVKNNCDPLGCLGDLGWYNIRFSLFAYNFEMPEFVQGDIISENENGVPLHFQGQMVWKDDEETANGNNMVARRTATFFCSFLHTEQQWAKLSGEDGMIEIADFVIPFNENEHSFQVNKHVWGDNATKISPQNNLIKSVGIQEVNMWNYFAQSIIQKNGGTASSLFFMKVALKTQIIIDCLLESARNNGVKVQVKDTTNELYKK